MKSFQFVIIFFLILSGCTKSKPTSKIIDSPIFTQNEPNASFEKRLNKTYQFSCIINGKNWPCTNAYWVTTHLNKVDTKVINLLFSNQTNDETELIQLSFDKQSLKLVQVSMRLILPKKGGDRMVASFDLTDSNRAAFPECVIKGIINPTENNTMAGSVTIKRLPIQSGKLLLKNPFQDAIIKMATIEFEGIPVHS